MKNISSINKFFEIEYNEDFNKNIFRILKNFINFQHGSISIDGQKRIYSFGNPAKEVLKEKLKIKNTSFGEISISADKFSQDDKETFKICSGLISSIIKDFEISKIMKMQVNALQEGYLKIKQAEEAKTKFLSHMSHELRTPLNSILGFSELLGYVGDLNEKQKEYIDDIKISGINLLSMINEILDMSKIEANAVKLNKRNFFIGQVVSETENIIKPLLIKKDIKFIKRVKDFELNADYQKIQQVLLNLLSNAIKFTKDEIIISAEKIKGMAIISIKDNGIGIKTEDFDKIFDKFEQLNSTHENSTGLGLTITKELVKLHNGVVEVNSEIQNGTKFIIKIPLKS